MASESRVRCEIDFEAAGRQAGYLRAPLSRNTSGWGVVEIPVISVKNGSGPTILFTGGGSRLAYGGRDGSIRFWDVPPPALRAAAADRVAAILGGDFIGLIIRRVFGSMPTGSPWAGEERRDQGGGNP